MMKRLIPLSVLVVGLALVSQSVDAQRRPARRAPANNANNRANAAPAQPEAPAPPQIVVVNEPSKTDTIRRSLRNDNAIERNLAKERTPLEYDHIREDDAVYRQRVWREIDVREKLNLPFVYAASEDNGDQRFISILLAAIRKGDITAFNPIDDRFTTPMSSTELQTQLGGKADTIDVPDPTDPRGLRFVKKVTFTEFNPDDVRKYRLKEEYVFDKESSRMFVRILGIAPVKTVFNDDGSVRGESAMFWVYYPDCRATLAKYEAFNGKNFGARMSWEELFESRYFSSYITKTTMDNPYNRRIQDYIKDPILRLLEGEAIKEKIFNYEQDLWSY